MPASIISVREDTLVTECRHFDVCLLFGERTCGVYKTEKLNSEGNTFEAQASWLLMSLPAVFMCFYFM